MNLTTFPINSNDAGAVVKNLHEALLSIARRSAVPGFMVLLEDPAFLRQWNTEYQTSVYGDATRQAIIFFQQKHMGIEPTGTVDAATASAVNSLQSASNAGLTNYSSGDGTPKVYGTVYDEWIEPVEGAPVMVFDKDIRNEHLLGEGETDDKGSYSIAYTASKLGLQDKGGANLVVRVYSSDGNPLYTSDICYNAPTQLEINVNLGPRAYLGTSQFVKNTSLVKEFIGRLAIHELTENTKVHDFSYLINKTGVAVNLLLQLVACYRFEKWTGVEAEVYYGILSKSKAFAAAKAGKANLPADADTLIEKAYINFWTTTIANMMVALQQAATKNIVSYKLLKHKDDIQAALQKLQANPPQDATATQPLPAVYSNIKTAGLNDAQQKAFLSLYSATSVGSEFWDALAKDPSFQGADGIAAANKLQAVSQLSAWTANNAALTSYITQTYSVTAVGSFASLVQYDVNDWVGIITASGAVPANAAGATATISSLAATIAKGIEQMHPTQVFAARFAKNTELNISNKAYITGILNAADFDITKTSVGAYVTNYLTKNPAPETTDQKTITYQVMGLQRTYKVTQGSDAAIALLGDNIQSARQVYAMGKSNFVAKYQTPLGSETAAGTIFDRAAQVHAGATHLMGQMTTRLNNPSINVMPRYNDGFKKSTLLSDYPDLANLFGMAPAYCECTDCESFLGIPAYLADLLDYLYQRPTAYKGNARALLQANDYTYPYLDPNASTWRRRPDIGDIDLDCDNANVELPYIDIVNELLEDYIVPPLACIEVPLKGTSLETKTLYFIEWVSYFLAAGKIKPLFYEMLLKIGNLARTPICNISLLTKQATVSDMFLTDGENYPSWMASGPLIAQWVIRDQFITLKVALVLGGRMSKEIEHLFGKDVIVFGEENFSGKQSNTKQIIAFWEDYFRAAGGGDLAEGEQECTLIVQEIHQTHLSTKEINANPEYTNTNVYNSFSDPFNDLGNNKWDLYPTLIPLSLPFDLYFSQTNIFLNKMGVQRYSLINAFQKKGIASASSIAIAYLGLSAGDGDMIFKERIQPSGPDSQQKFWGTLAGSANVEVDLFLTASSLSFQQLQTLLTLKFINPNNDSYIAENNNLLGAIFDPCNTANMLIVNMTAVKFDHINRFLRLWNKLNVLTPISMHELDLCISNVVLGNNHVELSFAGHMYYFLQLMAQLGLTATQTLVFYGDIDTTKDIYNPADISLYQQLFQNRQISNPLVPAFNMPLNTVSLITDTKTNPGAIPVILTACGIAQADLTAIIRLNSNYTNLTLDNLSVMYAFGLLSNALSISVQDVITFSGLLNINPLHNITSTAGAATPADTFNFITKFNEVQQAGFTVDGINYMLNNQSTDTPSLIPNANAVVNGLLGIRTALQTATTSTTVLPDPQGALLKTWLSDPDLGWDATIAAKVTAILATAGTPGYSAQIQNNLRFLQLLNTEYQQPGAAAYLQQMPAITFPDNGINNITYDSSGYYLFYNGTMTPTLFTFLQAAAPSDATTQAAIKTLHDQSQVCPISAVPMATGASWVGSMGQSVPALTGGTGALGFTSGAMTAPVYTALLAQSSDPAFGSALAQLFIATQSATPGAPTFVQLAVLPAITLPGAESASLTFSATAKLLSFTGVMSAADALALLGLAPDALWKTAVCTLYTTSAAGQTVTVPLAVLPAGWGTALPDITSIGGLGFSPATLSFSGIMTTAELAILLTLSSDVAYTNAVKLLFTQSNQAATSTTAASPTAITLVASVPLAQLPAAAIFPITGVTGLVFSPAALCFTGQMGTTVKPALENLSADSNWKASVDSLFNNSQSTLLATAPLASAAVPSGVTFPIFGVGYETGPGLLTYTGVMGDYILELLIAATSSPNAAWEAAVTTLYQNAQANLVSAVQFTLPAGLNDASFSTIAGVASVTNSGITVLSATGQIPPAVNQQLLNLSADPTYTAAIGYLFAQKSAIIPATLPTVALPLPDTFIYGTSYTNGYILFGGTPNPDCMDEFNLQQLGADPAYSGAIGWIYTVPPDGSVGAVLAALPPITLPTTTIPITWGAGELGFTGQMQDSDYTKLQNLSNDPLYAAALSALNAASQITSITTVAALPSGVTAASLLPVICQQGTDEFVLSFTGLMTTAQQTSLLALSADGNYTAAINNLYTQAQAQVQTTVPLATLPPVYIPTALNTAYDPINGVLYYSGATFPMDAGTKATLSGLSSAPEYLTALNLVASASTKPVNYMVYAPPPQTPFATDGLTLYNQGGTPPTITYVGGTIGFTNQMSFADYQGLLALSNNADYKATINYLFVTSIGSSATIQSSTYLSLPPLTIPAIYANQLSYAPTTNMLTLKGYIASADLSALLSLSNNSAYQQTITTIYGNVNNASLPAPQFFAGLYENVWPQASGALAPPAAATLYTYFLNAISPVYQPLKLAQALQAQIVANFGLSAAVAAILVTDLPTLLTTMASKTFTGNTGAVNPDPNQCPQALWYLRLARMAFVITGFNFSAANTDWLLKNGSLVRGLYLLAYPDPINPQLPFHEWEELNSLCIFNRQYAPVSIPNVASIGQNTSLSVYDVILAAQTISHDINSVPEAICNPGDLLNKLQLLTGWNTSELLYLLNVGQPALPNLILNPLALTDTGIAPVGSIPDLSDISKLMRLAACFTMASQLKVVPSRCVNWVIDPITNVTAVDIKQALKSIYPDTSSWMRAIQPLMNTLRQNRRDALVAYLLANVVANPYGNFDVFPDEYHMYGNFLIDVEMAACQPTTRIIQAYCSIQLFVQRCLMNIEAPAVVVNTTLDADWQQWGWMGAFETWYAARYTLLYPENFILPQALPNQSSFFADMQKDLTQGAVTTAIVTTAYGNYLQSLDEVARLEVKGMWYDHPTGVLHVFARTYGGDPAVYFYRTLNALQQWSPWEKVTADIAGDQIIPVVQNGRVYLYWPVFTQTSDDDKSSKQVPPASGSGTATPPPLKYWAIQMAFSEYINGQWGGKKISKDTLISQTIISGSGSPVIYPDTSEFVFIALDIPENTAINTYAGTMQALQNNSNMHIACYQSIPKSITITFTLNYLYNNAPNFTETPQLTLSDPQNPSFQLKDLFDQLGLTSGSNAINITSKISTVYLSQGDPSGLIQNIMNPQLGSGNTVNVSVSYTINASPDSLTLINQVENALSTNNAFLLNPTRGYCTAVDMQLLDDRASTINHEWFSNTNLYNMMATGSGELSSAESVYILGNTQGASYNVLLPFQMGLAAIYNIVSSGEISMQQLGVLMPFFYQDASCTFFVGQAIQYNGKYHYYADVVDNYESPTTDAGETSAFLGQAPNLTMDSGPYYQFNNFYHPFAHQFIKIFAKPWLGIDAIMPRSVQLTGDINFGMDGDVLANPITNVSANPSYQQFSFSGTYSPSHSYVDMDPSGLGDPLEQMDFGPLSIAQFSGYGQYNWELFFHGALMSAMMLSQNQQFADADTWFKFIFNPTDTSKYPAPQKFWVTKPFFENTSANLTMDEIILMYEADPKSQALFWLSVNLWRNDPYDPHMLAQLRITPYMYTTFMKYLDNLIAWANFNYQQYTMESVNIAIQLFMSALECLGTQPVAIPPVVETPVCNYYQVELDLEVLSVIDGPEGYLSDPIVQFENLLPPAPDSPGKPGTPQKIQMLPGLYFCIPPNPVLLSYWTTINTQLTKIQNCMNIAGQFQPLSPFPNVPGVGNMDGSGISDFGGVLPNYRFTVMIQKATELCNEVKSLGNALLAALEKEDAEGLALLRASQEIAVQQAIDKVKQLQITDAQLNLQNLQNNLQTVNDKIAYYTGLIQNGLIPLEQQALSLNQFSLAMEGPIDSATLVASVLKLIPNFNMGMEGFGGSPEVTFSLGGQQLGGAADCFVQMMSFASHFAEKSATIANTNAGYARRLAEWNFQLTLANDELAQVNTQIKAAQNKIAIAMQDEENQQLLIQNAENVDTFLTNKYTNQQLYSWMVTQISNVYFQSYQLAYSFAKLAEVCFGYELGITGASYINYGYWDSLHKGLLSGEGLLSSLKKMEADYYNLNMREYELTRQISLAQLDPVALLQLKSGGTCFINIPEELFDLDYPGHYFRRVKHISVTIPGVVGPYTPVCLKMTLMSNSVRIDSTAGTVNHYPRNTDSTGSPTNDSRFLDNVAAVQYIATSSGVNDGGLFEMNLHDERYLPFERAGAISIWQLEFPSAYPQFDRSTITDLIIHISYTARDGGPMLQSVAAQSVQAKLKNSLTSGGLVLMRGFSARRDFPTQWYKFLNPATGQDTQQLVMDITQRFPYFTKGLTIKISQVAVVADVPQNTNAQDGPSANPLANLYISGKKLSNSLLNFGPDPEFGAMQYCVTNCKDSPAVWTITNGTPGQAMPAPAIAAGSINDLAIIFYYSVAIN